MKYTLVILFGLMLLSCTNVKTESAEVQGPFNVLMIAVDDLRPELGCYGVEKVKSPNIDKLAAEGTAFMNSFCNIPVCGSSRASILTSTRPTRYRYLGHKAQSDIESPHAIAINEHFKNNGYNTISNGKIFHVLEDQAESWDENWRLQWDGKWRDYRLPENIQMELDGGGPPFEKAEVHDTTYNEGKLMLKTIADLKKLKASGKPFFLASGFVKPHLPFNAPKKYWDMYSRDEFTAPLRKFWPENAPDESFHNSGELRQYGGMPKKGFLEDSVAITLQHGYYACISYVDALIGEIMQTLDDLDLRKNTIVVLWGDHGWNLGDHGLWNKHCNYETSLNAPLIFSAPGQNSNGKPEAIVEFIDIFPTIADLCGLEIPSTVEGKSLVPLLANPKSPWTDYAICKFRDGLTIKTSDYAYTEYRKNDDVLISRMLYNHNNDPDETDNIVDSSVNQTLVDSLQALMNEKRGPDYFVPIPGGVEAPQ
jgi:arylsulfatase A-like enzyme